MKIGAAGKRGKSGGPPVRCFGIPVQPWDRKKGRGGILALELGLRSLEVAPPKPRKFFCLSSSRYLEDHNLSGVLAKNLNPGPEQGLKSIMVASNSLPFNQPCCLGSLSGWDLYFACLFRTSESITFCFGDFDVPVFGILGLYVFPQLLQGQQRLKM